MEALCLRMDESGALLFLGLFCIVLCCIDLIDNFFSMSAHICNRIVCFSRFICMRFFRFSSSSLSLFPIFFLPAAVSAVLQSHCLPLLGKPQFGLHSSYIYDFSCVPLFIYNRAHACRYESESWLHFVCDIGCLSNERACNNCELCRLSCTRTRVSSS